MKYKFGYVDKLRPIVVSSALLFGSAFDKAIEAVLKDSTCNEKEVFDTVWETQKINKREVSLPTSLLIKYSKADLDESLLLEEDRAFLQAKTEEDPLALDMLHNLTCWLVMRRKGHLMLDAHREQILPRYKKIINTQVEINLNNSNTGDTLIGFPDLVAEWEDGRTLVFDYKTSSVKYPDDAVKTSPQLTIYCHALDIKSAGYMVFNKNIKAERICETCKTINTSSHKLCPNIVDSARCKGTLSHHKHLVDIQVIIDDIQEKTEEEVLASIETTNQGIHNKVFEKNTQECYSFGRCQFFDWCHKGNGKDLEEVK